MTRYGTTIEDGTVYVDADLGRIEIGDLDTIIDLIGGPAWTIRYVDEDIERYPDLDTSDEGLTVDVVDTIEAMTFSGAFVETLKAQPTTIPTTHNDGDTAAADDVVSPRLGLFVGRLLENLEYGVR